MKRKDCLPYDTVVIKPLVRHKPESSWVLLHQTNAIPEWLYKMYITANYFTFDKCPEFLNDKKRILFSHLETSIELIKSSFEEYPELIKLMKDYDAKSYTPIKKLKGEDFDRDANQKVKRYFQLLIINMYSIFDCIAESIAIILPQSKLKIGKTEFSNFVAQIKNNKNDIYDKKNEIITNIDIKFLKDINEIIKREIWSTDGPDVEWYSLLKLYRNKLSHFRNYTFCSLHDIKGNFYHFLPKQWPYYVQQDIAFGQQPNNKEGSRKHIWDDLLMEQDIFEYCEGLRNKIFKITNEIFKILREIFDIKKNNIRNMDPLIKKQIPNLIKKQAFKYFQ